MLLLIVSVSDTHTLHPNCACLSTSSRVIRQFRPIPSCSVFHTASSSASADCRHHDHELLLTVSLMSSPLRSSIAFSVISPEPLIITVPVSLVIII